MGHEIRVLTIVVGACAVLSGCSTTPTDSLGDYVPSIYVEGYLRAGKAADSIYVGTTSPLLEKYTRQDLGITDATVTLTADGIPHALSLRGDGYYGNTDLIVVPGKDYALTVVTSLGTASATTRVPEPPVITASGTVVSSSNAAISMVWTGDAQAGYLTTRKTVALGESIPIELQFGGFGRFGGLGGAIDTTGFGARRDSLARVEQWRFVRQNETTVDWRSFTHYGVYTLLVYTIDANYGDFLVSSQQDPRMLDEPRFHITGGVGLLGSIAADSVVVTVE